jgi:hypothetical protein
VILWCFLISSVACFIVLCHLVCLWMYHAIIFPSLLHKFSFPLGFHWPPTSQNTITLCIRFCPPSIPSVFQLAATARCWKTLIMAIKWKSLHFNVKLEITHLHEVSSSSKSKTGRWNRVTSVTLFYDTEDKTWYFVLYWGPPLQKHSHLSNTQQLRK